MTIKRIYLEILKKWYATEKLHGSNFSIYFNGTDIKFAKRNSFLDLGKEEN